MSLPEDIDASEELESSNNVSDAMVRKSGKEVDNSVLRGFEDSGAEFLTTLADGISEFRLLNGELPGFVDPKEPPFEEEASATSSLVLEIVVIKARSSDELVVIKACVWLDVLPSTLPLTLLSSGLESAAVKTPEVISVGPGLLELKAVEIIFPWLVVRGMLVIKLADTVELYSVSDGEASTTKLGMAEIGAEEGKDIVWSSLKDDAVESDECDSVEEFSSVPDTKAVALSADDGS